MTTVTKTTADPKANEPKYFAIEDVFHANTTEGKVQIPMRFKTKLMRQIAKLDETSGVFLLVDSVCDEETIERIDELDNVEMSQVVTEYFKAQQKFMGAPLGE